MDTETLYAAAIEGDYDAIAQLAMKVDQVNELGETILHVESENGNTERVRFILREFANKNLLTKLSRYDHTALHLAAYGKHTEVAEILIDAAKHLPVTSFQAFLRQADWDMNTALHIAVLNNSPAIVKLLVEADPNDTHIQNDEGKTPMYIAVKKGFEDIEEIISTTCTAPSLDGPDGTITAVRIKNFDQDTLYCAAISGDADAIAKLAMEADQVNEDNETILHTATKKGNTERVRFILREFVDKNLLTKVTKYKHTALHFAASRLNTEVAKILIDAAKHLPVTSFQAFLRQGDKDMDTALHAAVINGNLDIVTLLVEADPTDSHIQNDEGKTPMYIAVEKGFRDIVQIVSTTCTTPSLDGPDSSTALHAAIKHLDHDIEVINLLISAARHLIPSSDADDNDDPPFLAFLRKGNEDLNTALHIAVMQGNLATAKLLVEADPSDTHIQNKNGETPIYIAAEGGYYEIVKMICTTCTAPNLDGPGCSTALHAAIKNLNKEKEDIELIKLMVDVVKRANNHLNKEERDAKLIQFFNRTDEDGCIILELAAEKNCLNVVELILAQNPAYQRNQYPDFIGLMPLIYKAMDKENNDMVNLLTDTYKRGARTMGIFMPFTAMPKLISSIGSRKEESVLSMLNDNYYARNLVTFADNLGWTALHHAAYHEFDSIIDVIVEAQKKFQHSFMYKNMVSTPFHLAAGKGYTSTVIRLMRSWPPSSSAYTALDKNGQNILHLAALQSKREMIQGILKYCPEEIKNKFVNERNNNGDTPLHLLIMQGCFVPELLRYEGLDIRVENRKEWTAADMLYFEDQIIGDQVQIKIALDAIQIDPTRDIFSSSVLPSKRIRKDKILNEQAKLKMHEQYARMKEDADAIASCFADAIAGDAISTAALKMKADKLNKMGETILHVESKKGNIKNVRFIVSEFAKKSLLGKLDRSNQTALHLAANLGHMEVVQVLIDAARSNLPPSANHDTHNPVSPFQDYIRKASGPMKNTALHLAVLNDNVAIVKLLVEADPNDMHVQNKEGKTPIYMAAENGYKDIIKEMCTTCKSLSLDGPHGRTTALHSLIQNIGQGSESFDNGVPFQEAETEVVCPAGETQVEIVVDTDDEGTKKTEEVLSDTEELSDLDSVKDITITEEYNTVAEIESDVIVMMVNAAKRWTSLTNFKALFSRTDEFERTVLQLAVERNDVNVVRLILQEDPDYQPGGEIKRNGLMRLICKAIDNEYSADIIKSLSETYKAGIIDCDPNDVVALILSIQKLDKDHVFRLLRKNKKLATFSEDNGWTPLHYAVYYEFDSILDVIIETQKDVGYSFIYTNMESTPFYVAIKYGYTSRLLRLMEIWSDMFPASIAANSLFPYTFDNDGQNILHLAAASGSRKEMVQGILKYCPKEYKEKIFTQQDIRGDTPLHLLISHGCFISELVEYKGLDTMAKNKKDFTPRDMLYVEDDIVADQVHIKIALDEAQTNQSVWKVWGKRTEKEMDIWKCNKTPPSKRKKKDSKFEEGRKKFMDKKHEQKKKELETYKMRTNTQILVTALITTVTFTVGFTMPGGLGQSGDVDEGLVVLSRKRAFNVFMVSDALALLMSTSSLFFYFLESMNEDPHEVSLLNASSTVLNILSIMAMMLTFIAGTYVVLSGSPVLAIAVCIIGSLFFFLIILWIIKIAYYGRVKTNVG